MEALSTFSLIVVSAVVLFLLYKTGLMEFITNTITASTSMADSAMKLAADKQNVNIKKSYGKLHSKVSDDSFVASNSKDVRDLLKRKATEQHSTTETTATLTD